MKNDHIAVLLENLTNQFKGVTKVVIDLAGDIHELKQLIPDIRELKSDIKIIRVAVTDQTHQLNDHEDRIISLEQVA